MKLVISHHEVVWLIAMTNCSERFCGELDTYTVDNLTIINTNTNSAQRLLILYSTFNIVYSRLQHETNLVYNGDQP